MSGPQPPVLVPIRAALDALHEGNQAALTGPLSRRRYDRATLDRLIDQLARTGARIRGQIDWKPPCWIEAGELLDYRLEYRTPPGPLSLVGVIVAVSRQAYRASEIRDRSAPRRHPDAAEPRYAKVVWNLTVETAPLMAALAEPPPPASLLAGAGSDVEVAHRQRKRRRAQQVEACKAAIAAHFSGEEVERMTDKQIVREIEQKIDVRFSVDSVRRALDHKK